MPTGYTAEFHDRDVSFEEFVWKCSRAMGALFHMRDDSFKDEIKLPELDISHYQQCLKDAQESLEEYISMSLQRAELELEAEYKRIVELAKRAIEEKNILRDRYSKVLNQVNSWTPPTAEHEGFKKFMVEQLNSSIKFDCDISYWQEALTRQDSKTAQNWIDQNIAEAKRDIGYYTKQIEEEKVCHSRNMEWIQALMNSVPLSKKV